MPNNKKRLSHKHVFATTKKMQKDTILTVVVNMIRYIFVIVGEIPTISQVYQYIHVWFVIPAHFSLGDMAVCQNLVPLLFTSK